MTLLITYRHEVTCTIQEDAVDVIEAERGIKLATQTFSIILTSG